MGTGYSAVRIGPPPVPTVAHSAALFTVAGNGRREPVGEGGPATAAGLGPGGSVAPLPGRGFLVTDRARVRLVDPAGRIVTVAGNGRRGSTGDGGPATMARVSPSDLSALPGGGFLIAECDAGRVRRVTPDGTISTVAGNGRYGFRGDGGPATEAQMQCPRSVSAMPDGSFAVADSDRVRRIGSDGVIATIAGTGELPDEGEDGGPALRTAVSPSDVAALPDGELLVADDWAQRVYRLADGVLTPVAGDGSEGLRRDDGLPATDAAVSPAALAPAPGGGFYVVDRGFYRATGSQPRLRFVGPDGTIFTLAGTGRFAPEPTRADELRGDGMPPQQADLRNLHDVAVLDDGGVVFTEGLQTRRQPGLVRYLPPPAGGLLAVAVRRDRDRVFAPSEPGFATVALVAPADVTVTVSREGVSVATLERTLPAGESRVELGALTARPHTIEVTARDAAGRQASDRAAILPRRWLTTLLARTVAEGVMFTASDAPSLTGSGLLDCRRLRPHRVDCRMSPGGRRCRLVVTVRLGADGRLRWGSYGCPVRRSPRLTRPLRPLRRGHVSCESSDVDCPPDLFGVVDPRWLVPWD